MTDNFDLESLVHLEQIFYDSGYQEGHAHGRIHGLIEGRALGREKGFEMWEELGFYEGFALLWKSVSILQGREDDRALNHIKHLLTLISEFPRANPSVIDKEGSVDVPKLFRQIRSRYKALCAAVGIRPSLRAAEKSLPDDDQGMDGGSMSDQQTNGKEPIWTVDNRPGDPIGS
ncbi:hypothetical protein E1B28_008833 [Marasmius oreades]|uniref:Essential protein Yae1 N-terminal domain-containing protein n=1 Tax=Marasmius oreades TaxID=181124 RepID=A0A9P7S0F0_9AGAR|nr:uncharacterized protein E1B28_008833 [Marasmius oreades]KAG7092481.1 hypothetical protein E1B28_008833 [Marasmius oreades]